ncbi:MAG: B12-binding domain-containing radical SAM protein [Thermodesulfobacteriota bacterium]
MKTLLVIPNIQGKYFKPGQPHVGIAYLAGALGTRDGFQTKIVDMRLGGPYAGLADTITSYQPDLIGITVTTLNYQESYGLIAKTKKHFPRIPIVIGGPHVTSFAATILDETDADFAIVGEGEDAIVELATQVQQGAADCHNIAGLVWRDGKTIITNSPRKPRTDLDSFAFPRYEKSPLGKYLDDKIPILTSRGCPGRCVYCSVASLFGRNFRTRTPENVFSEISFWYERGHKYYIINDDCFTAAIPRAEKICDLIISHQLDIRWECRNGIRMDRLTPALAAKMKQAGCCFVAFGLESANQQNLDAMRKGITIAQAHQAIKIVKEAGIDFGLFFMIGTPGDTFENFLDSYNFARTSGAQEVRFYNALPYPGTDFFSWVEQHGHFLYPPEQYLNSLDRWDETPVFATKEFPKEKRIKAFRMGEELVMRAFFRKYFGKILAPFCWYAYRNRQLRALLQVPGEIIWTQLRKLHLKRNILARS